MAQPRIGEAELVLPALLCIERAAGSSSTSDLISCLRDMMRPAGDDLEALPTRNDDKFSQKVRNLASHGTLAGRGLAVRDGSERNSNWKLTSKGLALLNRERELLDITLSGRFPRVIGHETLAAAAERDPSSVPSGALAFEEDELVIEGDRVTITAARRTRSRRLRRAAIEYFTKNGTICCVGCGFDYSKAYGARGKGYMEIHHLQPIHTYSREGMAATIREALSELAPLCSNCHRMVHRFPDQLWNLKELRSAVDRDVEQHGA